MRTSLRLPDELAEKVRERAAAERRSMHSMLLLLIEGALSERGIPNWSEGSGPPPETRPALEVPAPGPRSESDPHFKPDFKPIK